MDSDLKHVSKTLDGRALTDSRGKLAASVQFELSGRKTLMPVPGPGGEAPQSRASTIALGTTQTDASIYIGSAQAATKPSHLIHDLEIAGIAVAATGLLVGSLKYKPLSSLAESVLKLGGKDSVDLAALIPKYPELSIKDLVLKTADNLNQGCLSRETFDSLVGSVDPADRPLASSIAKLSLPNASDFTLMHGLRDMGKQLEARGINLHEIDELTSANPASPGQTTAYLFRKANGMKLGIHNLGAVDAPSSGALASNKPIFIFDHVADFDGTQLEQLQKAAQNGRQIFLMDANNFHTGINFNDFAKGTAEAKLQGLVEQAKTLGDKTTEGVAASAARAADTVSSPENLAYRLLNERTDIDAASIGATVVRPAAVSDETLFRQLVNRDKVEAYLARFQNPAHQRFAAETLADIDYESFVGIAKKTQKLHEVIAADAAASGLDPTKDVRYLVGVDNWPNLGASSGGFISSIYREMNGLEPQRFVDFDRMYYKPSAATAARRTYVLDDMSHSGEQIRSIGTDLSREYGVRGLTFSTNSVLKSSTVMKYSVEIGSPKGLRFLSADLKDPIAESSRATIKALKAEQGFFQSPSAELLQAKARRQVWLEMTQGVENKKELVANQLNPYVVSDRTNPITADFAKQVLYMQQWGFSKIE